MDDIDMVAGGGFEELIPVCGIGASAGGITALQDFFATIADDLGFAYVVIVHLSPDHPSQLSEILSARTAMPVYQVDEAPELQPNCVYVIVPDRELVIEGNGVRSRPFSEPRGRRAPIDMFFRSIAEGRTDGMAVVLSGAGSDGSQGVRAVKEAGGVVLVQDPDEAEYKMMPRSAIATGVADFVAPIATMVERIAEISRGARAMPALEDWEDEAGLRRIMDLLRMRIGHDFSNYKRATVMRRIRRRMQVTRNLSLAAYSEYLRGTPEEAQELFGDLLISVTMFFRDPAAFDAVTTDVIAPIFEALGEDDVIRVWAVGCATGEEAYSLAIVMLEEADRRMIKPSIQIFASDLDEGALATAREGRYPRSIEVDVSEERLNRFFIDEGSHYLIRDEVREIVLFAHHSALKDPPFMNLDLVSCRNLLIYLERELQRPLLALFHYALKPGGYLFLGSAETVDSQPELFTPCNREAHIYLSKPRSRHEIELLTQLPRQHRAYFPSMQRSARGGREKAPPVAHASALEEKAPPSVLVDEEHHVLNLSDSAGRFILPSAGPLSADLPDLVRPELRLELRNALQCTLEKAVPTLTPPITVAFDGQAHRRVAMYVTRAAVDGKPSPTALVFFIDGGPVKPGEDLPDEDVEGVSSEIRRLREELRVTQERLRASRHEREDAVQDLRIANEELQSTNEEYRSTAEELETSKEELQSLNEELETVNSELKGKLDSVAAAHSDLQNLIHATEIGTLFLDTNLRIKMLTPSVEQLFNVADSDIGRPITDFTHKLVYDDIEKDAGNVLRDLMPIEREVATNDDRWLIMRLRPYRTVQQRIEGIVVTFVDVTERRRAEEKLRESEERYRRALFEAMDEGFVLAELVRDDGGRPHDVRCIDANPSAARMLKSEVRGRLLSEVGPRVDREWSEISAGVTETGRSERMEVFLEPLGGWFDIRISKAESDRVAILFQDITGRKRQEEERELLVGELNHRVKNMLAVVVSVARQTQRGTDDPAVFVDAFEKRIQALARAHSLLTERHWRSSDLGDLARVTLDTFMDGEATRIHLDGPAVELSPNATVSFAMALHELGTNALKHGALSVPEGRVDVSWRLEPSPAGDGGTTFRFEWVEHGGPPASSPERNGFGTRMLQRGISRELDATVALDYGPEGFTCSIVLPTDDKVRPG